MLLVVQGMSIVCNGVQNVPWEGFGSFVGRARQFPALHVQGPRLTNGVRVPDWLGHHVCLPATHTVPLLSLLVISVISAEDWRSRTPPKLISDSHVCDRLVES